MTKADNLPGDLGRVVSEAQANDVSFYRITLTGENYNTESLVFTVREIYKKRRQPFPSTIKIREEQMIKFVDSK